MRTPLFDQHLATGGRMVEFAGWEMPVQYAGILGLCIGSACFLLQGLATRSTAERMQKA